MKFVETCSSNDKYRKIIEIKSLKGLLKYINDQGDAVIISKREFESWDNKNPEAKYEIEIYDDYRE